MSAAGVSGSIASSLGAGPGSSPRAALHAVRLAPITQLVARKLIVRNHYLGSLPGGTMLAFGIFLGKRLLGAVTLGAGPYLAYQIVEGAKPDDCITLTRLWLSDELPRNAESRILGIVLRSLRKETGLKFVVAYSDPAAGHLGIIYQASGWVYTGMSSATPLYSVGNSIPRHSRSLSHELGSHSISFWRRHGIDAKTLPQAAKHRYIYFLDRSWLTRLTAPVLPYPRREEKENGNC